MTRSTGEISHVFSQLGKEAFHKPQHFDYRNGAAMIVGSEKPGIGKEPLPGQELRFTHSTIPSVGGGPLWITFDKQVCAIFSQNGTYILALWGYIMQANLVLLGILSVPFWWFLIKHSP